MISASLLVTVAPITSIDADRRPIVSFHDVPPEPARVVGCMALLIDVLRDIAARPPETLSAAEAKPQDFFDGDTEDLLAIFDQAKDEMIADTSSSRNG